MPVSDSKMSSKTKSTKKVKKDTSGSVHSRSSRSPSKAVPEQSAEAVVAEVVVEAANAEEEDNEGDEVEEGGMEGDDRQSQSSHHQWGEGGGDFGDLGGPPGEDQEGEEGEEEAEDKPAEHIFMCHEIVPRKSIELKEAEKLKAKNSMDDGSLEAEVLVGPSDLGIRYRMLNPKEMLYRPAAMAEINSKIAEFNGKNSHIVARLQVQIASQMSQYGCHRTPAYHRGQKKEKKEKEKERMEKLMIRLKIYKRVLSTLVIYFRAYAPLLFDIKKAYDDMLNYRIRQFKAAQYEKLRIYHDLSLVCAKMRDYQFPDYHKLLKGQQYLNLLLVRIHKQDEAILCLTEILRKMERALADHYEQERDLQEQIRLLDHERMERMEKAAAAGKKFEVPVEDEENDKKAGAELIAGLEMNEGDEDEEDLRLINMKMNDDQKMACILAYAVCLKDLEEAQKKLKIYETRYMNVAPRHEVETLKLKIQEERNSTAELNEETETLESDLLALKDEEVLIQQELETYRRLPEDDRLRAVKARFLREQREAEGVGEDAEEHEDEDEDEEEDEGEEQQQEGETVEEGNDGEKTTTSNKSVSQ